MDKFFGLVTILLTIVCLVFASKNQTQLKRQGIPDSTDNYDVTLILLNIFGSILIGTGLGMFKKVSN